MKVDTDVEAENQLKSILEELIFADNIANFLPCTDMRRLTGKSLA